jgi:SRSO17 transposase
MRSPLSSSLSCRPRAALKTLAAAIKARWICEQAHQQLKEALGLDHFEGRSWRGLDRDAPLASLKSVTGAIEESG